MPLTTHGYSRSKVLAVLAALALVFVSGCSQSFGGQDGKVLFCIDSDTAKEILSTVRSTANAANLGARVAEGVSQEELQTAQITVSLTGDVTQSKTKDFSEQGVSFSFRRIPIGASVSAQAQIFYTDEASNKIVFSEGQSEAPIIVNANSNTISLSLKILVVEKKEYNQVIKNDTTYTVINPIFEYEWGPEGEDPEAMLTNEISFVYEKNYESCFWKPADGNINVGDYQLARITYKGTQLKSHEENVLAFKTLRLGTFKNYYRDQKPASAESFTYEMTIPQGKKIDSLGIENRWNPEKHDWSDDFSFEVEKIELIKNPELAINYDALVYVDENPELQPIADVDLYGNTVKFKSKSEKGQPREGYEGGVDDGYAAAYWEFDAIENYDKVAITVKVPEYQNMRQINFIAKGYRPYYENEEDEDFRSGDAKFVFIPTQDDNPDAPVYGGESVKIVMSLNDLLMEDDQRPPTAIEIMNNLYQGAWGPDMQWDDDWTLEIEKVELIKIEEKAEKVIFDPNDDSFMTHVECFDGGDESLVERNGKKYLKVIPNEYNLNIYFPEVDLSDYLYAKVEVYAEDEDDSKRVGLVLRSRNEETEGLFDLITRTVDDVNFNSTNEIQTLTKVIGGFEKVNHLSAYVQDMDNGSPLSNQAVYIGRIIATTNKDVEYDPFKVWPVTATITLPEYSLENDLVMTKDESHLNDSENPRYVLTVTSGYETYTWKVNGEVQEETSNVFTFSLKDRPKDNYDITVLVEDQGLSTWAQVTVE